MKTAISIPDDLFEAAEDFAQDQGFSRSQLYSKAVAEYLAHRQDETVTERLNQVYSEIEARLDPVLEQLQLDSIVGESW